MSAIQNTSSLGIRACLIGLLACVVSLGGMAASTSLGAGHQGLANDLTIVSYTLMVPGGILANAMLPQPAAHPWLFPFGVLLSGALYGSLAYAIGRLVRR